MAAKYNLILLCVALAVSYTSGIETVNGRIKIKTVTTSACGDTHNFVQTQLGPAYELYGDFLDLEFVPWGRTVNNGGGSFTCQFGVQDCWANRLHRCVLNFLQGNQRAQMDYIACEMSSPFPGYFQSYACATAAGLSLINVDYCVNNPARDNLDAEAEAAAAQPMAIIDFVPAIVINDNIDLDTHNEARQRLSSMICFALADDPNSGVTGCQI